MPPTPSPGSESGRDLAVLGVLMIACAVLAALPPSALSGLSGTLRGTVLAPFLAVHRVAEEYASLTGETERIRSERDSLARTVAALEAVRDENRRLRRSLDLPPPVSDTVVAIEVVAGPLRGGASRTFELRDPPPGLSVPTGVFTHRGVVGVVRRAGVGRASGDFWTHPDFRVSVRTRDTTATGIVRPHYEGRQPGMLLEGAPYQATIPEGAVLVTTGLGGVFPSGVPVGEVVALSRVESGWERSYRVRPRIRPEEVRVGFVRPGGAERP